MTTKAQQQADRVRAIARARLIQARVQAAKKAQQAEEPPKPT